MTESLDDATAAVRAGIEEMPFNRLIGVRVQRVTAAGAWALLPANPALANHVGTVHPVAQIALAEAAAAAAVGGAFADLLSAASPLAQGVEVAYHRAVVGDLVAEAALPRDAVGRVRAGMAMDGHARFAVDVTVRDRRGEVALEATARWVVHRSPPQ